MVPKADRKCVQCKYSKRGTAENHICSHPTHYHQDNSMFDGECVKEGYHGCYRWATKCRDYTPKEETKMERRIPTKEQVLKEADNGPAAKAVMQRLFPDDFKPVFDWNRFYQHPFEHITIRETDKVDLSDELLAACREAGQPVNGGLYPFVTINMLNILFQKFNEIAQQQMI